MGSKLRTTGVALVSLLLVSAAFHPLDLWPLAWVAFVPWMTYHRKRRPRGVVQAFLVAYYVHFALLLQWVGEVSIPAVFVIPLLGMPFAALAALLGDRAVHRLGWPVGLAWGLPIVLSEWLRDQVLGLSWSSLGYTQWRWLEGVQIASILRVHGLSIFVFLVNGVLADLLSDLGPGSLRRLSRHTRFSAGIVATFGLALHLWGASRISNLVAEPGPSAAGIQVSTPPSVRRVIGSVRSWYEHTRIWDAHPQRSIVPDLLVISETALRGVELPHFPLADLLRTPMGMGLPGRFGDLLPRGPERATILGYSELEVADVSRGDKDDDGDGMLERNSAGIVVYPSEGIHERANLVANYHKRVCVPLGEVIPGPRSYPGRDWLKQQVLDAGGFIPDVTPGTEWVVGEVSLGGRKTRIGLNICYEVVFPAAFREQVKRNADFIVNISNDSWYGTSCELDLVHVQARFRAVEIGRSLFRVSNGGISTSIDGVGRYRQVVEVGGARKGVAGVLRDEIPIYRGITPWVAAGEPLIGAFLLLVGLGSAAWWGGMRKLSGFFRSFRRPSGP